MSNAPTFEVKASSAMQSKQNFKSVGNTSDQGHANGGIQSSAKFEKTNSQTHNSEHKQYNNNGSNSMTNQNSHERIVSAGVAPSTGYNNFYDNGAAAFLNQQQAAMASHHLQMQQQQRAQSNYSSKTHNPMLVDPARFHTPLAHQDGLLGVAQCPSVPGKNQRVLLNKRQGAVPTRSAARIFAKKNKPLMSAGSTMSQSKSQDRNSISMTARSFSSFQTKTNTVMNPPFGAKEQRFGQMELKELYNKDPGPGTYQETTQTIEENVAIQQQRMIGLNGQFFEKDFTSKQKRFIQDTDMLTTDPRINIGPGQYEPNKQEKHVGGPKMEYKGDFSLPFNEKNPLNYVRPITVNIYFKQSNPGVGQYNPSPIKSNANGCSSAFVSKQERAMIPTKLIEQAGKEPAPGDYDVSHGFENAWKTTDEGTAAFRDPVPKKIVPVNLYNPHAEPENDKNKQPEMGTYKIARLFDVTEQPEDQEYEPRMNSVPGGRIYTEDNNDRFGNPIRPMKPIEIVPGPGEYETQPLIIPPIFPQPAVAKGGYISENPALRGIPAQNEQSVPGPSYYNAQKEPAKISFLFNPAENWVN